MYAEHFISGCEDRAIRYAGKQYVLTSEARYTLRDTDYLFAVSVDADAKEVGTSNYVTIFWSVEKDNLKSWIASENWDSNIVGVIPIDPPDEDWDE